MYPTTHYIDIDYQIFNFDNCSTRILLYGLYEDKVQSMISIVVDCKSV